MMSRPLHIYKSHDAKLSIKDLVYTSNPHFRCWFISATESVIFLMKRMGLEPPADGGNKSFLDHFNHWYYSNNKESPYDGLYQFFKDFKFPNARAKMTQMLSNEDFFSALFGQHDGPNKEGCKFFDFLFPGTVERVTIEDCRNCARPRFQHDRDPQKLKMLEVPLPNRKESANECVQSLVDLALAPLTFDSDCVACGAKVTKTSQQYVLDDAQSIVIKLKRLVLDGPEIPPILGPGEKAPHLPYRQINRKVALSPELKIPSTDRANDLYFELCSSIQHRGSRDKGHFVAFVKVDQQFYLIDDQMDKITGIEEERVQDSHIFLYKRRDEADYC